MDDRRRRPGRRLVARLPQRLPPSRGSARDRRSRPRRGLRVPVPRMGVCARTADSELRATSATRASTSTASGSCEVRVDEWRGLVFVNLDDDAPTVAPKTTAHSSTPWPTNRSKTSAYSHRLVHHVAANWKVYCDNYGEGYHVPLVHPELNREIVAKEYRVDVGDHFCEHSAPARDGAINAGTWLWRYPNLALNVYPGGMNVERIVPDGLLATRIVVYDYFFRDLDAREANAEVVRLGCDIMDEDRVICEAVQRNLQTGRVRHRRAEPAPRERRGRVPAVGAGVARGLAWVSGGEMADTIKLNWRKSETHGLEDDPDPRRDPLHVVLDRRPSRRAAGHVRGPPPREAARGRAACRRDRRGPRGVALRREGLLPGRAERSGRTQARGLEGRADTVQRDARRGATTSTRASATWTSTASGHRSTSRRRSPGSAARCSHAATIGTSAWR